MSASAPNSFAGERSSTNSALAVELALSAKLSESFRVGARASPFTGAVTALLITVGVGWHDWLVVWVAAMCLSSLFHWRVHRHSIEAPDWRRRALVSQTIAGSVWGLVPLSVPTAESAGQALLVAALMGVMASGVPFAAPVRSAAFAFLGSLGVTAGIVFLVHTTGTLRYAAAIALASAAFYAMLADTVHRTYREAAELTLELEHRANTDPLTGALNRRAFARALQAHLDDANNVSIVFLDLDGFKAVNDSFGHDVGDELLIHVSRRLTKIATPQNVGRIGGDEFMVLSPVDEDPVRFGERVLAIFDDAFVLDGATVELGCSVGVAESQRVSSTNPVGSNLVAELVNLADHAQLEAKQTGGSRVVLA